MNKQILPIISGLIALFGISLVTKSSFDIYAFKDLSCFFAGAFAIYILSKSFLDKSGFKISVLDIALAVSILFFVLTTNDFSFQNEFLFKSILCFGFYFVMRFFPENSKLIKPIAYMLIFCLSVPAIIVIYRCIKELTERIYPSVAIATANFATFSDYMIIGGLLSLCLYYLGNQNQETNSKRILYFNTVFFLPLIMVGQSVNQSVVYIAAIGIVIARSVFKEIFQKKYLFNYAIALFFLSTLFFIPTVTNLIRKELRYIPISLNAFKENPITGTGFGTYNSTYNAAQSQYFYDKSNNVANIWGSLMSGKGVSSDDWTQYVNGKIPVDEYVIADKMKTPESDFIQILLETGLIGLIMFLIPVGIFLFSFYKLKDKQKNPVTIFAF